MKRKIKTIREPIIWIHLESSEAQISMKRLDPFNELYEMSDTGIVPDNGDGCSDQQPGAY